MFKFKKFTAIVVSAVLAFGMIGCGKDGGSSDSDKESKKKDGAVDTSKVESIYDAYDLMANYTKGSFSISADVSGVNSEQNAKITFSGSGKTDGKNGSIDKLSVDVNADETKMSIELKDFFTVADGRAYINLDAIVKEFADTDSAFGSYGLLLPDMDVNAMKDKYLKLGKGAFEAFLSGAEVSGKDGDFTAAFKDAEGYKKSITALFDWMDKNKDEIEKLAKESASSVDVKDYLNKLVDDIDDDLIAAAEEIGYGQMVNAETIEQIKKNIEEQYADIDIDEQLDVNLFENFDEAKKKIDEMSDEDWAKLFEGIDKSDFALKLKIDDDSFEISVNGEFANNEGTSVKADITCKFTVEDVSIKAPSNASKLVDIAKYVKENPDVLTKISAGFTEWAAEVQKAFGGISGGDDDDDWDDDDDDWDWDDDDDETGTGNDDDDWNWDDDDADDKTADDKTADDNDADDKTADDNNSDVDWDADDVNVVTIQDSVNSAKSCEFKIDTKTFVYDKNDSDDDCAVFTLADDKNSTVEVMTADYSMEEMKAYVATIESEEAKPVEKTVGGITVLTDDVDYVFEMEDIGLVMVSTDLDSTDFTAEAIIKAVYNGF